MENDITEWFQDDLEEWEMEQVFRDMEAEIGISDWDDEDYD